MLKKFCLFLISCLVASLPAYAIGLAKACANIEGVTAITITKQMMGLAAEMSQTSVDFNALARKLEQVEIVSTENESERQAVRLQLRRYLKEMPKAKEMLSIVDKGERVNLYLDQHSDGLNEYVIIVDNADSGELTAVILLGSLTPEEVARSYNPF